MFIRVRAWASVGWNAAARSETSKGRSINAATYSSSEAGMPIQKSASRGPAISSRNTDPRLLPVTRRTTSPIRKP